MRRHCAVSVLAILLLCLLLHSPAVQAVVVVDRHAPPAADTLPALRAPVLTTATASPVRRRVHYVAPPHVVAVVTLARPFLSPAREWLREYEYCLGLDYAFSRFKTVVAVADVADPPWPLLEQYSFSKVVYTRSRQWGKGGKETDGIRALLAALDVDGPTMHPWLADNNTVIVKLSGRYQPVRDGLVRAIEGFPDHDVWGKTSGHILDVAHQGQQAWEVVLEEGDGALMSFYYAMRLGHFRELYTGSRGLARWHTEEVQGKASGYLAEWGIRQYMLSEGLRFFRLQSLETVANVDDRGYLRLY